MTELEQKMIGMLADLKSKHGAIELKAEFEAEGTRLPELMRLKEIAERAGLGLVLKIGGAEAIRDMYDAQLVGVQGIMAPMVESAYALKKYLQAIDTAFPEDIKDGIQFSINVETKQTYDNLEEILAVAGLDRLSAICVGRVDLSGSLGLDRAQINSEQVCEIVRSIFRKTKNRGLKNKMGGGISADALPFIKELIRDGLLEFYETRKVVFAAKQAQGDMEEGILKAAEFELDWLLNKKQYYERMSTEDDKRIAMMRKRLGK